MKVTRIIAGQEVVFETKIQLRSKLVSYYVGGGSGTSTSWLRAWASAHECVRLQAEAQADRARAIAERDAERLAKVLKHQEKQKRRAMLKKNAA